MSNPASYLINNKIGGVNAIAQFSVGARMFVPNFNSCPIHTTTDHYGRFAPASSLNTYGYGSAPGCFSSQPIILNENSLRPVLSSNPLYKNIQAGLGGNGADTLFGAAVPGRANSIGQVAVNVSNNLDQRCFLGKQHSKNYIPVVDAANNPVDGMGCFGQSGDVYNSFVGSRFSDIIKNQSLQL
jgi:hypothetical protein